MRRTRGFSLVEVMVALVVTSVGLLGLAKMESLSLVSTAVASSRSLAAIQASSLASAMHADRNYWAVLPAATTIINASAANNFSTAPTCTTAGANACTPDQMRQYDLKNWAAAVGTLLPGYYATITCNQTLPINCTIQIQWVENSVAASASQTNISNLAAPTYTLYVEP